MYLLDTDTLVYWIRRKPEVTLRFDSVKRGELQVSTVSIAELSWGAHNSRNPQKGLQEIAAIQAYCQIIPFDTAGAVEYGRIKAEVNRAGLKLEDMDLLIAASALARNLTLVSNNRKHFDRVTGLRVESWAAA